MDIKVTFFGAAKNVTGSCYLIESEGERVLVDCGMYQGRQFQDRNYDPFPVPANTIGAVVLTHAHLDHCGRVPKLVKEGFRGKVIGTPATLEIAEIIMRDSAHLQEEDLKYKQKRHKKSGKEPKYPYRVLYGHHDVENTIELMEEAPYEKPVPIVKGITATFYEAGHIFGSTSIVLTVTQGGESRRVLFSGDVGRWDVPIIEDPHAHEEADYVFIESTYGDRLHGAVKDIPTELARVINETAQAGGNIIIPSFAVERTQELLYHLNALRQEGRIPPLVTFVDSPMAIRVTKVFRHHQELFDEEARDYMSKGANPVDFAGLSFSMGVNDSKAINLIKGVSIIIAGAGMCTGGRIKHHLFNNIARPECTVLFVGYQAVGTLGRHILERPESIRLFGKELPLRARVEKISGFSGHADRDELIKWISSLKRAPRKVFVTHGEEEAAEAFGALLHEKTGWPCEVPDYLSEAHLD